MADQPRRPRTLDDARSRSRGGFQESDRQGRRKRRRSRTRLPACKEQVTLRIDQDVLEYFQAGGPGWQDRINEALRKAAGK